VWKLCFLIMVIKHLLRISECQSNFCVTADWVTPPTHPPQVRKHTSKPRRTLSHSFEETCHSMEMRNWNWRWLFSDLSCPELFLLYNNLTIIYTNPMLTIFYKIFQKQQCHKTQCYFFFYNLVILFLVHLLTMKPLHIERRHPLKSVLRATWMTQTASQFCTNCFLWPSALAALLQVCMGLEVNWEIWSNSGCSGKKKVDHLGQISFSLLRNWLSSHMH